MDNDSIIMKVFNYCWIIIAFLPYFGGLGFIFAGWRVNHTRWMDEGIVYMIPFIILTFKILNDYVIALIFIVWIWTIIRAITLIKPYSRKISNKSDNGPYDNNLFKNTDNHNYKNHKPKKNRIEQTIDVNTATKSKLLEVPCFSEEAANRILAYRNSGHYIESLIELEEITGTDSGILENYINLNKTKENKYRRLDI